MKIYPSGHSVVETESIRPKDIPLSYLTPEEVAVDIEIAKEPAVSGKAVMQPVMPYEEFQNANPVLFDENGTRIESAQHIQRIGSRYYFIPKNAVEFNPATFSFDVTVKKNMPYRSDKHYNLRISCIDQDKWLSQKLISIFGDARRRGLSPNNVTVNNEDLSITSLANSSIAENDFVFIESKDGVHLFDTGEEIPVDEILGSCTNIWLVVDEFGELLSEGSNSFRFRDSVVYRTQDYVLEGYNKCFITEETVPSEDEEDGVGEEVVLKEHPRYPRSEFDYLRLFSDSVPALIMEKKKCGFVIVTEKSFFDHIVGHAKFVYELLMQIFLQSYYKTPKQTSWITDSPVDYTSFSGVKTKQNHETFHLAKLLENPHYDIGSDYILVDVQTDPADIVFKGVNENGSLFFQKTRPPHDPTKEDGHVSFLTSAKTVVLYKKNGINRIEDELSITPVINEAGYFIRIAPFRSTRLGLDIPNETVLKLENDTDRFVLCAKDNRFQLVKEDEYDSFYHGVKMAEAKVIKKVVSKNYDMRVLGGGLPEDWPDDYSLLDVGHINGRPYRLGGTLVITLPKRLEPHKDKIEEAVKQHMQSGDYPILLFE